jgi:hypothetical protein
MTRSPLMVLIPCALTALAVVALTRHGSAQGEDLGLRFISISGEGSSTKAWFEGAPPTGTRVQEALDRFAKEGYRFAGLQPAVRQSQVQVTSSSTALPSTPEPTYVLILEKK